MVPAAIAFVPLPALANAAIGMTLALAADWVGYKAIMKVREIPDLDRRRAVPRTSSAFLPRFARGELSTP